MASEGIPLETEGETARQHDKAGDGYVHILVATQIGRNRLSGPIGGAA